MDCRYTKFAVSSLQGVPGPRGTPGKDGENGDAGQPGDSGDIGPAGNPVGCSSMLAQRKLLPCLLRIDVLF